MSSRNRAAFAAFRASARKMKSTQRHRAALWENMLGTVYAANKERTVAYFDYDYELALLHIDAHSDVRVYRLPYGITIDDQFISSGKLVWFVIYE
jgi:hypothetical protein